LTTTSTVALSAATGEGCDGLLHLLNGRLESGTRPVRLFSRGMEQRLALARALLHDPDLILLDEPWSGLDAAAGDWLGELLLELRGRGKTIVVATHDFQRGLDVASRALIVHRGRLAWQAPVSGDALSVVDATYRGITGAVAA
jgi:heme exporter protein A